MVGGFDPPPLPTTPLGTKLLVDYVRLLCNGEGVYYSWMGPGRSDVVVSEYLADPLINACYLRNEGYRE